MALVVHPGTKHVGTKPVAFVVTPPSAPAPPAFSTPTLGSSPASLWDKVVAEKMALVLVKALEAVETNAGGDARLQRRCGLRALPLPVVIPMLSHEHCVVS